MKRKACTLLAIMVLLSLPNLASASKSVSGTHTTAPESVITGREFLALLVEALQLPVESPSSDAEAVSAYIKAAMDAGIYKNDYSAGLDKPFARDEIASTLVRATQKPLFDKKKKEEMLLRFPTDTFANNPLRKSIESGPDFIGDISRIYDRPEQVVTELEKALANIKKRKPPQLATDPVECAKDPNMCGYFISPEQGDIERLLKEIRNGLDPIIKLEKDQLASAKRMVYEATVRGLLTGTPKGELALKDKVTRTQAAFYAE